MTTPVDSTKANGNTDGEFASIKSFKSPFVTMVQLDATEIDDIIDGALNNSKNIDDSDDASKE